MDEDEQVALHLLKQIEKLHEEVERLRAALRGVIAEADRNTVAFIEARAALKETSE